MYLTKDDTFSIFKVFIPFKFLYLKIVSNLISLVQANSTILYDVNHKFIIQNRQVL